MKNIPPFRLKPIALSKESESLPSFKWAGEGIGNRHKLGGEPDFIQKDDIPKCPDCGELMTFF